MRSRTIWCRAGGMILAVFLCAVLLWNASCSGASGAPPVSIPAPAPAKIRVTSPNDDGLATVTGSAGAVTGGNTVRITNTTAAGGTSLQVVLDLLIRSAWAQAVTRVDVTANADGSFIGHIEADIGDSLSVIQIDPTTGEQSAATELTVPENAPSLSFSPAAVTVSAAGRGYAVGSFGGAGLLAIIDLDFNVIEATVNLTTPSPGSVAFDSTQNKLVVTDEANNTVLFVSLADPTIQTSLAVTGPQSVAVDTDTNRAVIGTSDVTNSVVLVNLATEMVSASAAITNDADPAAVYQGSPAVDADGGRAVIVSIFDDGSSQITAKDLPVPAFTNFEVLPGSTLNGAALVNANQAVVIDSQGNRFLFADLVPLGAAAVPLDVGINPRRVALDAGNNRALVSNFDDHTLSIVDLVSRTVTGTEETGINPQGISFSSTGNVILVGNTGNDSVTIIH